MRLGKFMSSNEFEMADKGSRSPVVIIFLTIIFSLPFGSNEPMHLLMYIVFLLAFPVYVFFSSRKAPFSVLSELKKNSPATFYCLLLFAISSVISWLRVILGDVGIEQKILSSLRYVICWFLAFYSFMLVRFSIKHHLPFSKLFMLIGVGTALLVLLLFVHFWFVPSSAYYAAQWWQDPPFGSHIRIIGMLASVAVAASAVPLYFAKLDKEKTSLLAALLFISWALVMWSGGRISIVAIVVLILLLSFAARVYLRVSWSKLFALFMLLLLASLSAEQMAVFSWSGMQRAAGMSSAGLEQGLLTGVEKIGNGRIEIWQTAFEGFMQSPLWGLGPYGYYFLDRPSFYDHTHNFLIEFLVEWGLIGASLLLASFSYVALFCIKQLKLAVSNQKISFLTALSVVLVLSITGLADGVYFLLLPCFIVVTGFAGLPLLQLKDYVKYE